MFKVSLATTNRFFVIIQTFKTHRVSKLTCDFFKTKKELYDIEVHLINQTTEAYWRWYQSIADLTDHDKHGGNLETGRTQMG